MWRVLPLVTAMPVTISLSVIWETASALRWPRWQCQVIRSAVEVVVWAVKAMVGALLPSEGKVSMMAMLACSLVTTVMSMTSMSPCSQPVQVVSP